MEKLCIFCIHAGFSNGGTGTYADPAAFECAKNLLPTHYGFPSAGERYVCDIEDWREIIITAQTCKAYEQVKT